MSETLKKILQPIDEVEARSTTVEPFSTLTLDAPPSCLKFVPGTKNPHHLVVGTYSLDCTELSPLKEHDSVQSRSGSLILLSLENGCLKVLHSHTTPYAVLDICFFQQQGFRSLIVATSIGCIERYRLTDTPNITFEKVQSFQVSDPSVLVLSLEVSSYLEEGEQAIGLSLSNGQIGFVAFSDSEQYIRLSQPHTMEAWSIGWSDFQDEEGLHVSLYSGGDDSILCKSGPNLVCTDYDGYREIFPYPLFRLARDLKTHQAGITAILPIDFVKDGEEHIIITGSYDEHIRILTLSDDSSKATVLAEERVLGGGVWKLKLLKPYSDPIDTEEFTNYTTESQFTVLASCMHAGARIIEISRSSEGKWEIRQAAKCIEHESMNYASDARHNYPEDGSLFTVVSSSFYDKKICAWNYKSNGG